MRANPLDNDAIKNAIMASGAVNFAFYWSGYTNVDGAYWSQTNKCYYYNGSSYSNHEIDFIGWDDNFDKTLFRSTPAGNGAFLCRNSWGASFGDNGYFWLSYYDTSIDDVVSFNNAESITNYGGKYDYDPFGWVDTFGVGGTVFWGANIFTATATEKIAAVGFYLTDVNATAEIYIYSNVTAGAPRSGTLASTTTISKPLAGYYTVPLTTPVSVTQGQNFSVVIKFTNNSYVYPNAVERYWSGYSSAATNAAGQSFYSAAGTTWFDWASYSSNTYKINNCIKAYTQTVAPEINLKQGTTDIPTGGTYGFGSKVVGTDTDTVFTIENTGTAALTLTGLPWRSGARTRTSSRSPSQPVSPVAAAGSTSFTVRFHPTSDGDKAAQISIASNDGDENPYVLNLTGTGSRSRRGLSRVTSPNGGESWMGGIVPQHHLDLHGHRPQRQARILRRQRRKLDDGHRLDDERRQRALDLALGTVHPVPGPGERCFERFHLRRQRRGLHHYRRRHRAQRRLGFRVRFADGDEREMSFSPKGTWIGISSSSRPMTRART